MNEKLLLKTPVFDVVEKSFDNIGFKPVGINCNDWALIILHDDTNYLFVRQTRWGIGEKTIEFPCGTVEIGEDPKHCIIRELEEETGIKINSSEVRKVGQFNPNPAYFKNNMHVFSCYAENVKYLFEKHSSLKLDKNEDCEPFVGTIDCLTPTAITYAALHLFQK